MTERAAEIKANYDAVVNQINLASTKPPRLVVVSKYKPVEDIQALYDLGHRHFGENYVQELTAKVEALPKDIEWHFIGSLQTNKCKVLGPIPNLYAVETTDSEAKCTKLNNARSDDSPKLNVFIQINTSGEDQKGGVDQTQALAIANHVIANCPRLNLEGLMTIGSLASSMSGAGENNDFTNLVQVAKALESELGIELQLSMGMSNDFLAAIKQGSSNVRVGSAIFGSRKSKDDIKAEKAS